MAATDDQRRRARFAEPRPRARCSCRVAVARPLAVAGRTLRRFRSSARPFRRHAGTARAGDRHRRFGARRGDATSRRCRRCSRERGWGPITVPRRRGVHGGQLPTGRERGIGRELDPRGGGRRGWDPPNVVVNLGSNDVGFCGPDVNCNANTIRYLLDRIGPGHTVWWSTITRHSGARRRPGRVQPRPRDRRRRAPVAPPVGLAAAAAANGIAIGPDGTHLRDTASYRRRSELMAADITAQLTVATRVGGDAAVPVASGAPIGVRCHSIPFGCSTPGGRQGHASRRAACRRSTLAGLVPAGSRAVAVSLTSADPAAQGFLTADACGQRPNASSANYAPGGARAAFAVVPLRCRRSIVRLLLGGHRPDRRPAGGVRWAGCTRRGGDAVHAASARTTRRHPRVGSGRDGRDGCPGPDRPVWRSTSPPPVPRPRVTSRRSRVEGPCRSCRT